MQTKMHIDVNQHANSFFDHIKLISGERRNSHAAVAAPLASPNIVMIDGAFK